MKDKFSSMQNQTRYINPRKFFTTVRKRAYFDRALNHWIHYLYTSRNWTLSEGPLSESWYSFVLESFQVVKYLMVSRSSLAKRLLNVCIQTVLDRRVLHRQV